MRSQERQSRSRRYRSILLIALGVSLFSYLATNQFVPLFWKLMLSVSVFVAIVWIGAFATSRKERLDDDS